MKKLFVLYVLGFLFFEFQNSPAKEIHYQTQLAIFFATRSLIDEGSTGVSGAIVGMIDLKRIMEATDTIMRVQYLSFGPYVISDDPARDSIMEAEGQYGKRTLAFRAFYVMQETLKNPESEVSQLIDSLKRKVGAQTVVIVVSGSSKYYTSYSEPNIPILVMHHEAAGVYKSWPKKMIFDSTSTKAKHFVTQYPPDHPRYPEQYGTQPADMQYTLPLYARPGFYKDSFGFWLPVGDEDHNVLDPDHGWKLDYLYNKGLLTY